MAKKTTSPPRPGEVLLALLERLQMSQAELCQRIGRSRKLINEIIKGKASIAVDTAYQLELGLGEPAATWTNLERDYQDHQVRRRHTRRLEKQLDWLDELPVEAMIEAKWLARQPTRLEQAQALLRWFGVASPERWREIYAEPQGLRLSPRDFSSDAGALAAWIRAGELQAAGMDTAPYARKTFMVTLRELRGLTRERRPAVYQDAMIAACIRSGVALAWAREPPGLRVAGLSRWLSPRKALIQLSLLHPTDADLWFTFFHEAAHIVLHSRKQLFVEGMVEGEGKPPRDDVLEEVEADHFAANLLIPTAQIEDLREVCEQGKLTVRIVRDFADEQGVAPGIVIKRLEHLGWQVPETLSELKHRIEWAKPGTYAEV
jgi:HTH-type transcriptional regulator / antitoxin HigA